MGVVNPANLVTAFRLLLVIPLVLFLDRPAVFLAYLALFLLLDAVDGWLARRFRCASLLGRNFDLLVDSIAWWVLFLLLLARGTFPLPFLLAFGGMLAIYGTALLLGARKMRNTVLSTRGMVLKAINGGALFGVLVWFVVWPGGMLVPWALLVVLYALQVKFVRDVTRSAS